MLAIYFVRHSAKICVHSIGFITLKVSFSLARSLTPHDFREQFQFREFYVIMFGIYFGCESFIFNYFDTIILASSKESEIIFEQYAYIKSGMDSLGIASTEERLHVFLREILHTAITAAQTR